MELVHSSIPLYAVFASLFAIPLILLSSRHPDLREMWTMLAALTKFVLVISLLPDALAGRILTTDLVDISPGVSLSLAADPLGVFFALIASGLWILTSLYSIGYMRGLREKKQTRYFASFALCLSATIGIAFSANLLTFLVFYEILTIATYPLVIHKGSLAALQAGRKYLVYTLSAGVILIIALAWTHQIAGSLDFKAGGLLDGFGLQAGTAVFLFVLFLAGVGVKSAIMPLHSWLPAAMIAPTPVSALLHAVAVVKSGVFGVMRVVGFVFGPVLMREHGLDFLLAAAAAITILLGSLLAFRQDNLKRLLAYSTIGHLSYVVLGAALLSSAGMTGGLMHIAAHATMKITLFFCAGAIYVHLRKENISELDGIGKTMPWTMGAFTVTALGLAGIPPVNGFVSKWFLGLGAIEADHLWALAVLLVSGLLNAGYFAPIIYRAYFRTPGKNSGTSEAPAMMVAPLVITALLSAALGILPNAGVHFHDLATLIASTVLGSGR
ncbi:MAG: monovalent cation/H+ antiporter subunit D family protein [Ignavibacteriales bacterium]|nr:monovalent cation/H+ antiporter subunit D family protein [Ignavibacteriales bacterium]